MNPPINVGQLIEQLRKLDPNKMVILEINMGKNTGLNAMLYCNEVEDDGRHVWVKGIRP